MGRMKRGDKGNKEDKGELRREDFRRGRGRFQGGTGKISGGERVDFGGI